MKKGVWDSVWFCRFLFKLKASAGGFTDCSFLPGWKYTNQYNKLQANVLTIQLTTVERHRGKQVSNLKYAQTHLFG